MLFKTLDIRQLRTMIDERQGANKVSPTFAQVYCLEKSKPWTGRGNPGRAEENT